MERLTPLPRDIHPLWEVRTGTKPKPKKGRAARPNERRRATRYAVSLPLTFSTDAGLTGKSTTIDISTTGLRFKTDIPIGARSHVEVAVEWPAKFRGVYKTRLMLHGTVVRAQGDEVALKIARYAIQAVNAEVEQPMVAGAGLRP